MIAAYTFFSNAHRTYTKNDYVEPNFNKLKKTKSIQHMSLTTMESN